MAMECMSICINVTYLNFSHPFCENPADFAFSYCLGNFMNESHIAGGFLSVGEAAACLAFTQMRLGAEAIAGY